MLAHVARSLAGATALAVVGNSKGAMLLGATDLHDPPGAMPGPLAGVLAALDWAQSLGAAWLVTAPCDTPLLPNDLGETLIAHAAAADAAHACSEDGVHALCAAWRPALAERLRGYFAKGLHPPVRELAPGAVRVTFANGAAFMNVNTPTDMARAQALLGGV